MSEICVPRSVSHGHGFESRSSPKSFFLFGLLFQLPKLKKLNSYLSAVHIYDSPSYNAPPC